MDFTKEKTNIAKGVAILLMFSLHLYGFKERLINNNNYIPLIPWIDLEYYLASIGKICVPIFIFLSGYGMFISYSRHPERSILRYSWLKLKDFYVTYWLYFSLFIPIGLLFFPHVTLSDSNQSRYSADLGVFLLNWVGWDDRYNNEWWFVRVFLILLIVLFPLYGKLAQKNKILGLVLISLFLRLLIRFNSFFDSHDLFNFMFWQIFFAAGIVCAKLQFFSTKFSQKLDQLPGWSMGAFLPGCLTAQYFISNRYNFWLIPLFIYISIRWIEAMNLAKPCAFLGKYAFPLWLIHSFFCYYYWQDLIYFPRWSPFILLWLLLVSLGVVLAVEWVLQRSKHFAKQVRWRG
ncbi:acyltransferase family protein [Spirulina subsalsa]|uniref:acyltransferase family protein n=1 Tax=Spirulina subsalsa TaxID=54311 RepID=UPI0002E6E676|nr:acyltransferase [Spirulina subsalsa]